MVHGQGMTRDAIVPEQQTGIVAAPDLRRTYIVGWSKVAGLGLVAAGLCAWSLKPISDGFTFGVVTFFLLAAVALAVSAANVVENLRVRRLASAGTWRECELLDLGVAVPGWRGPPTRRIAVRCDGTTMVGYMGSYQALNGPALILVSEDRALCWINQRLHHTKVHKPTLADAASIRRADHPGP